MRITVNVSAIGQTAGVLNYSAAVGKDAEVSLPAARPAVLADGTILAAEFPVKWDIPKDLTATIGTKNVKGTATVFDQNFEVTAAVRVTNGEYKDGAEALATCRKCITTVHPAKKMHLLQMSWRNCRMIRQVPMMWHGAEKEPSISVWIQRSN